MKIGITGYKGFIAWHLRCYLFTLNTVDEVRLADRDTFSDSSVLIDFVSDLDIIFHFAGVNRSNDQELYEGNIGPAKRLIEALSQIGSKSTVVFSSSTYALNPNNSYGKGKSEASSLLRSWEESSDGKFINLIIPNVFGEYCKPNYNSVVATFCHQIANRKKLTINDNNSLELVHVQDLAELLLKYALDYSTGTYQIDGFKSSVTDVADRLQNLYIDYIQNNILPDTTNTLNRSLFNTLRSYIPHKSRVQHTVKHVDERGWLVETVKAKSGGQCFVSTTKPSVTRGNHFHRRKIERFFILQGSARIQIRKLFTNEIITYDIIDTSASYIDIPTLHTHNITNIGNNELITLFWADELFDSDNSDTYFEKV